MPLQQLWGKSRGDKVVDDEVLSGSLSPAQVVDKGGDERGDEFFLGKQPENMWPGFLENNQKTCYHFAEQNHGKLIMCFPGIQTKKKTMCFPGKQLA